MNGMDLRTCVSTFGTSDLVVFRDKEGKFHKVNSFKRVRADGVPMVIFSESYAIDFPFVLKEPPKELLDYLNEHGL